MRRRAVSISKGGVLCGSEDDLQRATAQAYERMFASRIVAFHCPNGGKRDKVTAAKMKAMGVMPGVADWVVLRRQRPAGLIELKTEDGRQSKEQMVFQARAEESGCEYRVVRNLREWIAVMEEFCR